jgi:hypothetical protein
VWDFFAKIVPLLQSTRLLQMTERSDMIAYIKEFGEFNKKHHEESNSQDALSFFMSKLV